jgi:serine/threonine-protein kinase
VPSRYLGRQIGRYQVTRLLGGGAFSWVYEAIDRELHIPVALKVLRPEAAAIDGAAQRFRHEATTAARLRHPNIVTVRDVGQVDGVAFVAMDLCPLTLARRLQLVPRLPEAEVVRLGLEIAGALAVAHAQGVVHRDIKPDNILLGTHGEAIVTDFGLARTRGAAAPSVGLVQGTPHYFSPEQARGEEADGRSDLYSLGVTLYRAITGRLPFDDDDWQAVARHHIDTPPPPAKDIVPGISDEFDAILRRLLEKDPERRFASATRLIDALAQLPSAPASRSGGLRAPDATLLVPTAMRRTRRRVGAWVAGALVVLAVATALWGRRIGFPGASDLAPATAPDSGGPPAATDSPGAVASAPSDTAVRTADPAPAPLPPNGPATVSRTVELTVAVAPDAMLFVDDAPVGAGRWTGSFRVGRWVALSARLPDAAAECVSARRDTVLQLQSGRPRVRIDLPVRGCGTISLQVASPRDAQAAIRGLDWDFQRRRLSIDSIGAVVVPWGRYEVTVSAARCSAYTDTLEVSPAAPVARRPPISLIC